MPSRNQMCSEKHWMRFVFFRALLLDRFQPSIESLNGHDGIDGRPYCVTNDL